MKIKGFENYEIFEDGRIVNKHGRELKYFIQSSGYNQICLWKDCKRKHFLLHRLLALHFIVNTRPGIATTVDHIDRNKLNNSLENLRWATLEEQSANRYYIPITKGCLSKNNINSYRYQWRQDKIRQCKYFKTLEEAKQFEIDHLQTYRLQFIN